MVGIFAWHPNDLNRKALSISARGSGSIEMTLVCKPPSLIA